MIISGRESKNNSAEGQRQRRGVATESLMCLEIQSKPIDTDPIDPFLGFEFYWEADTKGEPRVWRRTARKRLQTSINNCKAWVKTHRHYPLATLLPTMIRKVRGHYNYFRAVGNVSSLWVFYREVVKVLYKWLNRRSQRRSLTWDGIKRVLAAYAFPSPAQTHQTGMNRGLV